LIAACGSENSTVSFGTGTDGGGSTITVTSEESPSPEEIQARILSALAAASPDSYRPGEVIVKFKPGTARSESLGAHAMVGAQSVKTLENVRAEVVKLPEGVDVGEAVEFYMENPQVDYAEPNYIANIDLTFPNDTYFYFQWSLHNIRQTVNGVLDADIDMPQAWDISTGSRDFIVAVIDTGADLGHPDLALNIWVNEEEIQDDGIDNDGNGFIDDTVGWDFVNQDNIPFDDNLHGTHVSGIIGALGNNGRGVTGVNWEVRIMVLKVCNSVGSCSFADVADAILYAVNNGAHVMNASLGGTAFSQTLQDAVKEADKNEVLLVASAGNSTLDNDLIPSYPASFHFPNIIAVAASDQDDQFASFSNFGATSVDVVAPGNHTLSTWPLDIFPAGYDWIEGTSMAAPHVSGLAALLMDYYRHFTYRQIRKTIMTFTDRLPQFEGYVSSNGRINASKAIRSLLRPTGLTAEVIDKTTAVTAAVTSKWVRLLWTNNADGEDGYTIERKTPGQPFSEIASVARDTEEYIDMTAQDGMTSTYRVRAFHSFGESMYSNQASATLPDTPGTPGTATPLFGSGGGGGCSVTSAPVSSETALADVALLFLPALILLLRRKRKP
jgi:subtilisin family serine protease